METVKIKKLVPWAAIFFYLAIALEVIIMITPFTVYFYSAYAPILNWLYAFPSTAWLTAFFLPHITYPRSLVLLILAYLGPTLLVAGLLLFFFCAGQVYYSKLFRKGVVTKGPYTIIRHPQYLGLAIAGLGLLLFWPRFFILVTYITMLFVYYLLARSEEGRMLRKFGEGYAGYMEKTSMFIPGEPGARLFRLVPGSARNRGLALLFLYFLVLAGGIGLGYVLRGYAEARVSVIKARDGVVISLYPSNEERMKGLMEVALADPEVTSYLAALKGRVNKGSYVAYILPSDYMMQHLIADLGEHEEHHGKGAQGGIIPVIRHLGEMLALKPMRQLRDGEASREKRIIFTEAVTSKGEPVPVERAMAMDVMRLPVFFVDLDSVDKRVSMVMETPRRHSWGTVPVPSF